MKYSQEDEYDKIDQDELHYPGATNIMKNSLNDNKQFNVKPIQPASPQKKVDNKNNIKQFINFYKPMYNNLYSDILKTLKPGQKFTDKNFPPDLSSLTKNIAKFPKCKKFVWKRAADCEAGQEGTQNKKLKIFEGKIEPNDIRQGGLGDCYFLSSLSALAEQDDIISRLFESKTYNEAGCYCVWLSHDGQFKPIIVDDFFPCVSDHGGHAFSRAHGSELWVMLLEKAYAKIFGTYDRIEAGLTGDAIRDLTGAPFEYKMTSEGEDKIWEFIYSSYQKKYILTAGSQQNKDKSVEKDLGQGIVSSHAYAVLNVQILKQNGNERILKMRNPWGTGEWKGDWSDNSKKWTPQLKQQLNVTDEDDGIFWINIKDFCKQFSEVTSSKLHKDFIYTCAKLKMINNVKYVTVPIIVSQDNTKTYLEITQPDKRNFAKLDTPYEYAMMQMFVTNEDYSQFYGAEKTFQKQLHLTLHLNKGRYMAYIEIDWRLKKSLSVDSVVISSYSLNKVDFEVAKIDYPNDKSAQKILDLILFSNKPKDKKIHQYLQNNSDTKITRISDTVGSYIYWLYKNQSTQATLTETMELKDRQFLEICPPETNSNQFKVVIGPQQTKIIKYKIQPIGCGQMSYSSSIGYTIEFSGEALIQLIKKTKPKQRKVQGKDVEVYQYSLFTTNGLVLYWENNTKLTYNELCKVQLVNMEPKKKDQGTTIDVNLPPGKSLKTKFKIIDPEQGVSFGMSSGGIKLK